MRFNTRSFITSVLFALAGFCILTATASAQNKAGAKENTGGFCSNDFYSNGDQVSFKEVREMIIPATGSLSVDGGQNGGVRVTGSNRNDVQVRACLQTWGKTDEEAKALASGIRIETGGTITANSPSAEHNWSVSYEIFAPRNTSLNLKAHNGGISISGVEGNLEFETMNGGVNLKDVAGDVKGRTTNGGVMVRLAGNRWNGGGLDVQTTNGGVMVWLAENYSAHIETGTTNGGFKSDIPSLNVTTEDVRGDDFERNRSRRVVTNLNGGGPTIRVLTTNGGVQINSSDKADKN